MLLRESDMGCYLFAEFAGCVLYADDIILLSAFVRQLQVILDICSQYANDICLTFNSTKSYCKFFGKFVDINDLFSLSICLKPIKWVHRCMYLGVTLMSDKCFANNVDDRKIKFFGAVNCVLSNGCGLSEECLIELILRQRFPVLIWLL
jgi:hypothetical protein